MTYFNYDNKHIYYEEQGYGNPVIFLHGNTASAKMFDLILPLYTDSFKAILIDFLGHGRSDRLSTFPADLWMEEAKQTIALIEHLDYDKVSLVGTSGGAYVALNVALQRPDVIDKVVADSFDGMTLRDRFSEDLVKERTFAMNDPQASQFYLWCQGEDYLDIVNQDTKALIALAKQKLPLFVTSFDNLKNSTLLIGSLEDDMCNDDLIKEYNEILKQIDDGEVHMFKKGKHPTILSNAESVAAVIKSFLNK